MTNRLREMHRLLKSTGVLCVHLDYKSVHYIKIELDKIFGKGSPDRGAKYLINEIIWCYRTGGASKRHFSKKHDTILCYSKDKSTYTYNLEKERIYYEKPFFTTPKDKNGRYYADVLPVDWWTKEKPVINMSKESIGYPTQKPIALLERIIKASSNEGDVVLDPFCGSGTTCVAAKKLNRQYIGIDMNDTAVDISRKRVNEI